MVPEFLEFLSGIEISTAGGDEAGGSSALKGGTGSSGSGFTSTDTTDSFSDGPTATVKARVKDGKYGDHIMRENIAIKNEPKLMAEAIRTMLAKDDETG